MFPLIPIILKALVVIAAIGVVMSFWDTIRDSVASWLRSNGYDSSWLMEALIQFDKVVGAARKTFKAKIFVRGKYNLQKRLVKEYEQIGDEIDDEDVRNRLMNSRKQREKIDILEMVS